MLHEINTTLYHLEFNIHVISQRAKICSDMKSAQIENVELGLTRVSSLS